MIHGIYLGDTLKDKEVTSSAPCRLDVGGTWDLKAFALLYKSMLPTTTNVALSLRTTVYLRPYKEGWVRVSDTTSSEEYHVDDIRFNTRFGLIFAIATHFNINGVDILLSYEAPPKSGLGGSGVLAVTAIAAISKALESLNIPTISKIKLVELAHDIEDGLRYSFTGMQDQCAAVYGGVNKWIWTYDANSGSKFRREELLPYEHLIDLEKRLVVAYIGQAHDSSDVNRRQVEWFLDGQTRKPWFRINQIANEFALALTFSDWEKASRLISEESDIRIDMVPSRITSIGMVLKKIAKGYNAGFATAGAGNGGCVWALCCEPSYASDLIQHWGDELRKVETAKVLNIRIDSEGLRIEKM
jgi:D-glycero-alpha-D-manno-heptose-7-phosphate kinase